MPKAPFGIFRHSDQETGACRFDRFTTALWFAALTAKITVTRSEPLSPGTATTLTEFTVDGARLGDGVPIGLAVERGSTIVVTVDADSSEGDVLVAATLSQAVTIP